MIILVMSFEDSKFRRALQYYEKKEFESAFELVESLLKNNEKHGDAQCLKGLILHVQKKPGARQLVEEGVENAKTSSVAWHMAGIYYKLVMDFPKACEAFTTSYRLVPDNFSVQQDLSMVLMQQRKFGLLVEVRQRMLASRPSLRMLWLGLAVAQYLNNDHVAAEKTICLYESLTSAEPIPAGRTKQEAVTQKVEQSELILFRNELIAKTDSKAALADLEKNESRIMDKLGLQEKRAELYTNLKDPRAASAYRDLIKRNPNNLNYYLALERVYKTQNHQRKTLYKKFSAKYPHADIPKLQLIQLLDGKELENYIVEILEVRVRHAVPSAFMLVKPLYKNPELMRRVISRLTFDESDPEKHSAYLILVARHHSYLQEHAEAVRIIDEAHRLVPDSVDVLLAKAKILQRQGDLSRAADELVKASRLEKGDRYINTKAAKYLLQANRIYEGIEMLSVFPLAGGHTQDGLNYLRTFEAVEMLSWVADALHRSGSHSLALKRANEVIDIFHNYYINQYEFHYYGPRRGSLRAYVDLIHWEDNLYKHPCYVRVVTLAINEYIAVQYANESGKPLTAIPEDEKYLVASKLKPDAPQPIPKPEVDLNVDEGPDDADPLGEEYLKCANPLDRAFELWRPLGEQLPEDPNTWDLAFSIYLAQRKYALTLQAIKRAKSAGISKEWVAAAAARLRHTLDADSSALASVKAIQLKVLPVLAPGILEETPLEYVNKHCSGLQFVLARLQLGNVSGVAERLVNDLKEMSLREVLTVLNLLDKYQCAQPLREAAANRWPGLSNSK